MTELNSRIASMEKLLGNLHSTEARTGVRFNAVKHDLRSRLTACYLARDCLRRGEYQEIESLDQLLLRVRVRVEHRRYRKLSVLTAEEIRGVDLDALSRQLGA